MDYTQQTQEIKKFSKVMYARLADGKSFNVSIVPKDITPLLTIPEKNALMLLIIDNDISKQILASYTGKPDFTIVLESLFADIMKSVNYFIALREKLINDICVAQTALDKFNQDSF